jgi:hypothetical protein
MKQVVGPMTRLDKVYVGGVLLIFGLIVLHAPISVYVGSHFGHVLLVKAWKEILMGALLVLAAIIVTLRGMWRPFLRDPVIWLSAGLAVLYAVSMEYGQGFKPYAAGLLIDVRYILYLVLVYVAVRLVPVVRRPFLYVGLAGAVIVTGFGLLQFVLPKDFLSVLGYGPKTITPYTTIDSYAGLVRLQSTLRGPNPLGAYGVIVALIGAAAAIRLKLSRRLRVAMWVLVAAALVIVYASYSRGAYLGVAIGAVVVAGVLIGRRGIRSKTVIVAGGIGLVIVIGGLVALRTTTFYSSVFNHEVAGSGPSINSNAGHSASLTQASQAVAERPLGYGTGSTGSASLLSGSGDIVENQYLYVAHEAGLAALLVFIALYALLLERAYRQRPDPIALGVLASGIGLFVIGLVLPVFADDTVSIIWFGLAGLIAGGRHEEPVTE